MKKICISDLSLNYHSAWLSKAESQTVFLQLQKQLAWQQETIQMFGKPIKTPRLVAWYGDEFAFYKYSGVVHQPLPVG